MAEGSPDVYLEMARTAETESRYDAARQILEVGLKKAPASAAIYEALAGSNDAPATSTKQSKSSSMAWSQRLRRANFA